MTRNCYRFSHHCRLEEDFESFSEVPRPVAAVYVGAGHFEVVEDGSHVLVGAECSCEVAGLHISATFWRAFPHCTYRVTSMVVHIGLESSPGRSAAAAAAYCQKEGRTL